jgi:hypothetical protein
MPRTSQHLATTGNFTIPALSPLTVQSGIVDKDGNSLIPNFVQFDACNLDIIAKNADGTFVAYNPDPFEKDVVFRAHHLHSIEQEAIYNIGAASTQPYAGALPDCVLFGGFPLAVLHQRYNDSPGQEIPPDTPGPRLVLNFNISDILSDAPSPDEFISWDGPFQQFTFNKSGLYRVNVIMPANNIDETNQSDVRLALFKDPNGSPLVNVPAFAAETVDATIGLITPEITTVLNIDENDPVGLRTFQAEAWSIGAGVNPQTGDNLQAPFGYGIIIERVGEARS